MSENESDKTQVEQARDQVLQLKEMQHYAKSNVEKLAELWLEMEEKIKLGNSAEKLEQLLALQNGLQDALEETISAVEMECNRIENEDSKN